MLDFLSVLRVYWCKGISALFQIMGQAREKLCLRIIFTDDLYSYLIIRLSAIYNAKILRKNEKIEKNAMKTMTIDRSLGILTQFSNIFIIFASKLF